MAIGAVTFDAYGTLRGRRGPDADPATHRGRSRAEGFGGRGFRTWTDLYYEATQRPPIRTLREIQGEILQRPGAARLPPHKVLHVGDSQVDDVAGAGAAGLRVAWLSRTGRPRRLDGPAPDFEIRDLTELVTLLERAHRLRGLGRVRSIRHARRSAGGRRAPAGGPFLVAGVVHGWRLDVDCRVRPRLQAL